MSTVYAEEAAKGISHCNDDNIKGNFRDETATTGRPGKDTHFVFGVAK
jgi:hypothetical protein